MVFVDFSHNEKTALSDCFFEEFSYENVNLYKGKLAFLVSMNFRCLHHQQVLVCCSLVDSINIQNKCVRIMSVFENISKILKKLFYNSLIFYWFLFRIFLLKTF